MPRQIPSNGVPRWATARSAEHAGRLAALQALHALGVLDAASREAGTSRSEIVREALRRYFMLREYRVLRAELVAEAEAKGIITDEDVFDRVS